MMDKDDPNNAVVEPPAESLACDVPCNFVALCLADGYQGQGRWFENSSATGAVLYLHGIQSHGGWFCRSANYLRQQGMTVLMPDRRGSGFNQIDRGHADSARKLIDDVAVCTDWLAKKTGLSKVDLVGVSWGGKLALAYAGRHAERVRSLTLVAPGLCPRVDISLKEKISVGMNGVVNRRKLHRIPLTEPSLFTANPAMMDFIAHDPLMLREATASFFIASARLDALARQAVGKVKVPVRLFLAEHDRIIDNAATRMLLEPLLREKKNGGLRTQPTVIEYRGAQHTLEFEPDPSGFCRDLAAL